MTFKTDIDTYDGHLVQTLFDGELIHEVIHPPTCKPVLLYEDPNIPGSGIWDHHCAVSFCLDGLGPDECFREATTPGIRIVGWRHDTYGGGWQPVEHDVICFCLPQDMTAILEKGKL